MEIAIVVVALLGLLVAALIAITARSRLRQQSALRRCCEAMGGVVLHLELAVPQLAVNPKQPQELLEACLHDFQLAFRQLETVSPCRKTVIAVVKRDSRLVEELCELLLRAVDIATDHNGLHRGIIAFSNPNLDLFSRLADLLHQWGYSDSGEWKFSKESELGLDQLRQNLSALNQQCIIVDNVDRKRAPQ